MEGPPWRLRRTTPSLPEAGTEGPRGRIPRLGVTEKKRKQWQRQRFIGWDTKGSYRKIGHMGPDGEKQRILCVREAHKSTIKQIIQLKTVKSLERTFLQRSLTNAQ